jgi:hypothetical protein
MSVNRRGLAYGRTSLAAAATATASVILAGILGSGLAAQSALAQLGLTETAARTFVLDEIKGPASDRRSGIAIAGTRAFLKLPLSARGAAASALFSWAKAYVNSAAFKASYDSYRKSVVGTARKPEPSVDEVMKKQADEQRAGLEEMKKNLAASGLPPAEQEKILAAWKDAAAKAASPEFTEGMRKSLEAERAERSASEARLTAELEQSLPADPQELFARRLREFLDITADVNFAARTISLTGGADGIEFRDAADRQRHWIWQTAAIVGSEATAAARAAAETWLAEIER